MASTSSSQLHAADAPQSAPTVRAPVPRLASAPSANGPASSSFPSANVVGTGEPAAAAPVGANGGSGPIQMVNTPSRPTTPLLRPHSELALPPSAASTPAPTSLDEVFPVAIRWEGQKTVVCISRGSETRVLAAAIDKHPSECRFIFSGRDIPLDEGRTFEAIPVKRDSVINFVPRRGSVVFGSSIPLSAASSAVGLSTSASAAPSASASASSSAAASNAGSTTNSPHLSPLTSPAAGSTPFSQVPALSSHSGASPATVAAVPALPSGPAEPLLQIDIRREGTGVVTRHRVRKSMFASALAGLVHREPEACTFSLEGKDVAYTSPQGSALTLAESCGGEDKLREGAMFTVAIKPGAEVVHHHSFASSAHAHTLLSAHGHHGHGHLHSLHQHHHHHAHSHSLADLSSAAGSAAAAAAAAVAQEHKAHAERLQQQLAQRDAEIVLLQQQLDAARCAERDAAKRLEDLQPQQPAGNAGGRRSRVLPALVALLSVGSVAAAVAHFSLQGGLKSLFSGSLLRRFSNSSTAQDVKKSK